MTQTVLTGMLLFLAACAATAFAATPTTKPAADAANVPANTWVQVTPRFAAPPGGGRYVAVGWNKAVYDTRDKRILIMDRWKDDARDLTIYANAVVAIDPPSGRAEVLKLNNYMRQSSGGGYRTVPMPQLDSDPTPTDRHPYGCLAYVDHDHSLYLGPGANQTARPGHPGDTWRFDLAGRKWHKIDGTPSCPLESVMCYSPPDKVIVLYSASRKTCLLDVVKQQWRAAGCKTEPPAGMAAAMTFDSKRSLVYLFGGPGSKGKEWNTPGPELWAYSAKANEWKQLADCPVPARAPALAYDSRHDIVLASIRVGEDQPNRVLMYHPANDAWQELDRPPEAVWPAGASWMTLAYDESRDLFFYQAGGYDRMKWMVFRFDPTTARLRGPPATQRD